MVGLVLTVLGLAVSFWLAFVAFLCVLALAVMLETEIRVVGREKLGNLPINAWLAGSGREQQRQPEERSRGASVADHCWFIAGSPAHSSRRPVPVGSSSASPRSVVAERPLRTAAGRSRPALVLVSASR